MPTTIVNIAATDTIGDSRAVINDNFAALKALAESSEAELANKATAVHGHSLADVSGLAVALAGKADVAHTHVISLEELTDELLAEVRGQFPATVATNGSGDPTQILETGLTSANKKRRTDFTYDGSGNVATVEVRLTTSADVFLYGFRKTYGYTGGQLAGIAVEPLIS